MQWGSKLAYGEEKLKVPVLLLKHVDGFKIAEESFFIPRITRVMDLLVSPFIGEEDLSGVSSDVGKCIKNMSGDASQSLAV